MRSYAVRFIVAVTGHRDLRPDEIPNVRSRVRDCLFSLRCEYSSRIIVVMPSPADGADRIVAEEALQLGMPLSVVLPMPRVLYEEDFTPESLVQFAELCSRASEVFELPLLPGATARSIAESGPGRTRQYAQVGVFLCPHCHVLLALLAAADSWLRRLPHARWVRAACRLLDAVAGAAGQLAPRRQARATGVRGGGSRDRRQ